LKHGRKSSRVPIRSDDDLATSRIRVHYMDSQFSVVPVQRHVHFVVKNVVWNSATHVFSCMALNPVPEPLYTIAPSKHILLILLFYLPTNDKLQTTLATDCTDGHGLGQPPRRGDAKGAMRAHEGRIVAPPSGGS
jgi:hypothetical protein